MHLLIVTTVPDTKLFLCSHCILHTEHTQAPLQQWSPLKTDYRAKTIWPTPVLPDQLWMHLWLFNPHHCITNVLSTYGSYWLLLINYRYGCLILNCFLSQRLYLIHNTPCIMCTMLTCFLSLSQCLIENMHCITCLLLTWTHYYMLYAGTISSAYLRTLRSIHLVTVTTSVNAQPILEH